MAEAKDWKKEGISLGRETWRRFEDIHGPERAAAFGFYALFSMVPLMALLLVVASKFLDAERVRAMINEFALQDEGQQQIVWGMVSGLEHARGGVSVVSTLLLVWSATSFFSVLVGSVNRAWDSAQIPFWRSTLHNLMALVGAGGAVLLGILVPTVLHAARQVWVWGLPNLPRPGWLAGVDITRYVTASVLLFAGALILYGPAANAQRRWRTVLVPALLVTLALQVGQHLVVTQAPRLFRYNEIYGSVGGLMLLLVWLYVSGYVVILGGCLCAAVGRRDAGESGVPSGADGPPGPL